MTPFGTDAALAERPQIRVQQYQTTQLEKAAMSDKAPWLYSALAQLREIETQGRLIPGLGDLRVQEPVAMRVRLLLSTIAVIDLPVPVVSPISGGGVSITWAMGDKEVKYACLPDGQTFYCTAIDDEIRTDGALNLADPVDTQVPLRWMAQAGS
jgi:hypothetical protein